MWQNSFKSSHKFQPTCRLVYNLGVTRMEKWMHGPCKNINHVKYNLFPREWVIKNGMELTDKTIRSKKMMTSNLKNWPRVVETSMFRGLKQKKVMDHEWEIQSIRSDSRSIDTNQSMEMRHHDTRFVYREMLGNGIWNIPHAQSKIVLLWNLGMRFF